MKILNTISKECPNELCDGKGNIACQDLETGDKFWDYCEECRNKSILQNKIIFADIPKEYQSLTIKSFDLNLYETDISRKRAADAKKIIVNYVKNFQKYKEAGKGLYLHSETTGSGKTRITASLGNALLKNKNVSCKFITTINLLKAIQATFNSKEGLTTDKLIQAVKQVDVLILDDIGAESNTEWVNEIFLNLIDDRSTSKKVTIYTSNCNIEQLRLDIRTKARIEKMSMPVWMPEEDIRGKLAKDENKEMLQELLA